MRSRSQTTSSGGFSSASLYAGVARRRPSRSLRLPLYSQPKKPFFQTSAKPSPPPFFAAPLFEGEGLTGGICLCRARVVEQAAEVQKCSCAADRSFSSAFFHLAMNWSMVTDSVSSAGFCVPEVCASVTLVIIPQSRFLSHWVRERNLG